MQKTSVILILCFISLEISIVFASATRISEVEINPEGSDSGREWVELYSDSAETVDYALLNNDGDWANFSASFEGYYIYTFAKQWLDNSDEKIYLYKNNVLIDETDVLKDDKNDGKTWQFCGEWIFADNTKEKENSCEKQEANKSEEETTDKESNSKEDNSKAKTEEEVSFIPIETETKNESIQLETISLQPKDIKSEENTETHSKDYYAKYGFVGFCILIGLLFIMRKNKFKTEFE